MKPIIILEYQNILKQPNFQDDEWKELYRYREILEYFCKRKKYDIEEIPKKINNEKINLGGFIGNYRFKTGKILKIQPKPKKLKKEEFSLLIKDIIQWAGMFGSPFLRNLLNICSPIVDSKYEIILAYSDLLIRCTENAISEYIPPLIEKRRYKAPIPLGKILIPQTISFFSRGQFSIVSERINVNILNNLRIFLVKFHAIMSQELKNLERYLKNRDIFQEDARFSVHLLRILSQNRKYHSNFVTSDLNRNVINRAYEIDFTASEVLQELWLQASISPSFREIILLWEAFIKKKALLPRFENILSGGYMIKPLSKLYELWCLKNVLDVLEELFNDYHAPRKLPGKFIFKKEWKGWRVEALYNTTPDKSNVIKKLGRQLGVSYRKKPDIIVIFSKADLEIRVVIEVKYRLGYTIRDDDMRRFFWYLLDFGSKSIRDRVEGILLYIPWPKKIYSVDDIYNCVESKNSNVIIHLVRMKPNYNEIPKKKLKKLFCEILGNY